MFQGLSHKSCFIAKKEARRNWNRIIWDWLCIDQHERFWYKTVNIHERTGLTIAWIKWGWGNPRTSDTSDPFIPSSSNCCYLWLIPINGTRKQKDINFSNKIWLVENLMALAKKVYRVVWLMSISPELFDLSCMAYQIGGLCSSLA